MCDNILTDTCFYEITVFTGLRRGAGTRSNISFVLAGDNTDTGVRQLKDVKGAKVCVTFSHWVCKIGLRFSWLND